MTEIEIKILTTMIIVISITFMVVISIIFCIFYLNTGWWIKPTKPKYKFPSSYRIIPGVFICPSKVNLKQIQLFEGLEIETKRTPIKGSKRKYIPLPGNRELIFCCPECNRVNSAMGYNGDCKYYKCKCQHIHEITFD